LKLATVPTAAVELGKAPPPVGSSTTTGPSLCSTRVESCHPTTETEPRLGIGNVADLLTGSHQPGALGSLLGSSDNLDATACP